MKKTITSILFMFLASYQIMALNYLVSGFTSPNTSYNGLYIETGTINGFPYYKLDGSSNIFLSYKTGSWSIGTGSAGNIFSSKSNSTVTGNPPLTGWTNSVSVAQEGKSIRYKVSNFVENKANDGTLLGNVIITYNKFGGDKFNGIDGEDFVVNNKVTVTNVPSGLTAVLLKNNDSTLTLNLIGNASNQANLTNLTISFTNSAFVSNDISNIYGNTKNDIKVNFRKLITVAPAGADYTTIADAFTASAAFDIIQIAAGTYTEFNLTTTNNLIISGAGADKTIIQAASNVGTATNRVFTLNNSTDTTELNNLTVQNGYLLAGNPYGGGVYSQGNLKIINAVIKNNIAKSTSVAQGLGGGVYCSKTIFILNSEISGNKLDAGQSMGGGVCASGGNNLIINSTFANNIVVANGGLGGGLYLQGTGKVINSTFNLNQGTNGSGVALSAATELKNNIIFGNTGGDNVGQNGVPSITALNNITDANSIAKFNIASSNNTSNDPLLGTLANNGGPTQTIALLANSPAINAGIDGDGIPNRDQRGMFANGKRDIGAFEFGGLTCLKPVVTTDLMNQTICNGLVAKFKVVAIGENLNYNWGMTDGVNWMVQPSETKDSVEFNVEAKFNGATIFTIVSNACGNDTSFATLNVNVVDTAVTVLNGTITANIDNESYQWVNVSTKSVIGGATNRSFTPTETGNYAVVITQYFGKSVQCTDTSGVKYIEVTATGLENSSVSNFSIYPNPAIDNVTIAFTEVVSGTVAIVDLHGNVVATKSISGNSSNISTADLVKGVYVVKISTEKGVTVKQLVVR